MNWLEKISKLNTFLKDFSLPSFPEVTFSFVTGQADATSRLDSLSGIQVLLARPEMQSQSRDGDVFQSSRVQSAVFILTKDFGDARTDIIEQESYDAMLEIAEHILSSLIQATASCNLLGGIHLVGFDIVPETSIFGSWFGYSIVLDFE